MYCRVAFALPFVVFWRMLLIWINKTVRFVHVLGGILCPPPPPPSTPQSFQAMLKKIMAYWCTGRSIFNIA